MEERRQAWNDRQMEEMFVMVKETRDQLVVQNGTIKRHNEEIFGGNGQAGLKKEVDDLHDLGVQVKSYMKAILVLLTLFGGSSVVAFIYNLAQH